jgi:1,4-alpha-glucan branching enzyme
VQALVRDLNRLYRETPALHAKDCDGAGFQWIEADDADRSIYAWARFGGPDDAPALCVFNMTPVAREGVRIGVPAAGFWREALNTDAGVYGGSGIGNAGGVASQALPAQGRADSVTLTVPPLSGLVFTLAR